MGGDLPYKKMIIHELNMIFGNKDESQFYWNDIIEEQLLTKFMITQDFIESLHHKRPAG